MKLDFGQDTNIYDSKNSSIIGGYLSILSATTGSIIIGGSGYNGTPYVGSFGGNRIIGGQNNFVSGGFYRNYNGYICNFPNKIYNSTSSSILGVGI